MTEFAMYMLWLQVFMNTIGVVMTFLIARLHFTPGTQWYTLCVSLFLALLYRLIKLLEIFPGIVWFTQNHDIIIFIANSFLLPLTAVLIMIFTIQMYKRLKNTA